MEKPPRNRIVVRIEKASIPEIADVIEQVAKQFRKLQRQSIRSVDLTPPQFAILRMLWKQDLQPFKDLADTCGCTRSTVTGIIDSLEKKKLVRRVPNPSDRRSVLVKLTSRGKAQQKRAASLEEIYSPCCGELSDAELQTLLGLLYKLYGTFDVCCDFVPQIDCKVGKSNSFAFTRASVNLREQMSPA